MSFLRKNETSPQGTLTERDDVRLVLGIQPIDARVRVCAARHQQASFVKMTVPFCLPRFQWMEVDKVRYICIHQACISTIKITIQLK
jgi:hypothetical protein